MMNGNHLLPLFCAISSLPARKQQALILHIDWWFSLKPEKQALIIKTQCPDLKDFEIALLIGVCRTSLFRWTKYMRLKRLIDSRGKHRRGFNRRGFKTKDRRVEGSEDDEQDKDEQDEDDS